MLSRAPLDITRHCDELTESETDEVVGIVADLIVAYLKKKIGPSEAGSNGSAMTTPGLLETEA